MLPHAFKPVHKVLYTAFPPRPNCAPKEHYELGHLPRHPEQTPDKIYKDAFIQKFCFNLISATFSAINTRELIEKIYTALPPSYRDKPLNFRNFYTMYLKGGNVLPLLNSFMDTTKKFPYDCNGDFDVTLLLNPSLDKDVFRMIREMLLVEIVDTIKTLLSQPCDWLPIITSLLVHLCKVQRLTEVKIDVQDAAYTYDDYNLGNYLYNSREMAEFKFGTGCPFQVELHPNVSFKDATLNFALIKIRTRTEPPIDLIDISIPSRTYTNIEFEWKICRSLMFQDPELNFRFPVSDSLTAYIDYRIASLTDSRETKKALRTKRANAIRNTILKPLLESGYLTQGQVDAFKTIEYKHPMIKNLKTILSDVHL